MPEEIPAGSWHRGQCQSFLAREPRGLYRREQRQSTLRAGGAAGDSCAGEAGGFRPGPQGWAWDANEP